MGESRSRGQGGIAAALLAAAICGAIRFPALAQDAESDNPAARIVVDGASALEPLTGALADAFSRNVREVAVETRISGDADGFAAFCAGTIDIMNASRPISETEMRACSDASVEYLPFGIARDGVVVAVNENNTFVNCLNLAALAYIWQAEQHAGTWADLNPNWPAESIAVYGGEEGGGAFDLFSGAVIGASGAMRDDGVASADDEVLVEGIANDENAIGFLGYAAYDDNRDTLNVVAIDGGAGCVDPTAETIRSGAYAPFARPLSILVNRERLARPEVQAYLRFSLDRAKEIAPEAGYAPAADEVYAAGMRDLASAIGSAERGSEAATPGP